MMSNSHATVVPETRLVDVVRIVDQTLPASDPSAVQRQRRLIATQWIHDLCMAVREWNLGFIDLLNEYPGRNGSADAREYSSFFHKLADYDKQLQRREGGVKERLCRPLEHLNARLFQDFDWLKSSDPLGFSTLHQIVEEAYQSEVGVIRIAYTVISEVFSGSAPDANADVSATRADALPFLDWHIAHRDNIIAVVQMGEREVSWLRVMIDLVDRRPGFAAGMKLRRETWAPPRNTKGIECDLLLPIVLYCQTNWISRSTYLDRTLIQSRISETPTTTSPSPCLQYETTCAAASCRDSLASLRVRRSGLWGPRISN
jgi:hypothetical protein